MQDKKKQKIGVSTRVYDKISLCSRSFVIHHCEGCPIDSLCNSPSSSSISLSSSSISVTTSSSQYLPIYLLPWAKRLSLIQWICTDSMYPYVTLVWSSYFSRNRGKVVLAGRVRKLWSKYVLRSSFALEKLVQNENITWGSNPMYLLLLTKAYETQ